MHGNHRVVEDFCFVPEIRMSQCSKDDLEDLLPFISFFVAECKPVDV